MVVTILNYDQMQTSKNYENDNESDKKATRKRQDKGMNENECNPVVEDDDQEREISSLAERLKSIVTSQKKINVTGSRFNGWKKSISGLVNLDGVTVDRIDRALTWYEAHAGGEYIPVIESGRALREKFIKLENAIARSNGSERSCSTCDYKQRGACIKSTICPAYIRGADL